MTALAKITQIAATTEDTLVLLSDGTLWANSADGWQIIPGPPPTRMLMAPEQLTRLERQAEARAARLRAEAAERERAGMYGGFYD